MILRPALRVLVTSAALWMGLVRPAAADWQFAPFAGLTFKGSTTLVDLEQAAGFTRWHLGGAVVWSSQGPLGIEALVLYTPRFLDNPEESLVTHGRTLAVMGNLVLAPPRGWNEYGLRPFVSGGIGLLQTSVEDGLGILLYRSNLAGYNIGGGATGSLTNRFGLRFELRRFGQLGPGAEGGVAFGRARLSYWTTAVAVVIHP